MFGCLLCFPSGALRARRVSSAASRLPGITSLRFALHGWQREKSEAETRTVLIPTPLYRWPLAGALLTLLLLGLFPEGRMRLPKAIDNG
ncbi:MAG: hypothetical protein RPU73_09015 [Candidatus Sedimenticola sp. (ex Thyasira tokunagai)]